MDKQQEIKQKMAEAFQHWEKLKLVRDIFLENYFLRR
jgi:hypothetical protein